MKKLFVLATFMAVSGAYADRLYIVPVFATRIAGASGTSGARVHVFNPGPLAVNVTVRDIYPTGNILDCPLAPDTQTIHSLDSRDDIRPFCGANVVAAFTISSDGPLAVTDDIETTAASGHLERQSVRVLSDWLPANRQAALPRVSIASDGTDRTNLFLVNPNSFPITITVRITPVIESPHGTLDQAFDVPSRTTVVRSLPNFIVTCVVRPCHIISDVLVQANGIYYAGASWLENDEAVFRDPVLVDE